VARITLRQHTGMKYDRGDLKGAINFIGHKNKPVNHLKSELSASVKKMVCSAIFHIKKTEIKKGLCRVRTGPANNGFGLF